MSDAMQLIEEYNQLVTTHAGHIHEINDKVHEELKRRRIMYGGEVARTFLRPSILTIDQYARLEHACNVLIRSVNTILNRVFDGSITKMGAALGISPAELEFTALDPGYELLVAINRMDAFVNGDQLTFLEFNCDSPAGIAYADEFADVLRQTPFFQEFERRHKLRCPSGRQSLRDAFRRIYQEWGGKEPMRVAIVDWKGIATSAEFDMFQRYFDDNGIPTIIADPREAEYDGKTLKFDGQPINFVYKRVITGELLGRKDECKALLAAYRDKAACFCNSFRSRLADNKVIFALLSDPALADRFSSEERAVAAATIPWTRRVAEGKTRVDDAEVDLVPYIRKSRADLVLKPNTDYGGRNVAIGSETSQADWDNVIGQALQGDWVVQRRVTIPEEPFPIVDPNGLSFAPRKVNINPFALGGSYGGCVSRLSTQSVINVKLGGGSIPMFVVDA